MQYLQSHRLASLSLCGVHWRGQKGCENKQQRVRGPTCPDRQREGLNVPGLSILGYIKSSCGLSLAIIPPTVPLACLRKREREREQWQRWTRRAPAGATDWSSRFSCTTSCATRTTPLNCSKDRDTSAWSLALAWRRSWQTHPPSLSPPSSHRWRVARRCSTICSALSWPGV